jgi:hypothetical protein
MRTIGKIKLPWMFKSNQPIQNVRNLDAEIVAKHFTKLQTGFHYAFSAINDAYISHDYNLLDQCMESKLKSTVQ